MEKPVEQTHNNLPTQETSMRNGLFILGLTLTPALSTASATSPYTGEEARTVKALSAKDVQEYLAGKGMGLAKAAELNHYPGPRHALDLADGLGLSSEQQRRIQTIHDQMQTRAMALGKTIVQKERELDVLFASQTIDRERLHALMREIANHQGELRFVHLDAHLALRPVLTAGQIGLYDELRGYTTADTGAGHNHAH